MEVEHRLLIGGKLCEGKAGRTFDNVNPATEVVLGAVAQAEPEDVIEAISSARTAFDETSWPSDASFRGRCLEQLQSSLERHVDHLRTALILETGAPEFVARGSQCDETIESVEYWVRMSTEYPYEHHLPDLVRTGQRHSRKIRREPFGVVAAITPWNFPLQLNLAKLLPALAAGNTVVLKPAPDTPWCGTALASLIVNETDIPAGVVNIVNSSDNSAGDLLTGDPRVDMVTFTGSTAVGRRVMERGSATIKKVFLELGGKSAFVVLDDADIERAVELAIGSVCYHAGQGCTINTRLLLPRSHYQRGLDVAAASAAVIPFGDPFDPANIMGPVINNRQRDRILRYISAAVADGALLVAGGGRPAHLERGFFVEPTVLGDVDPNSTIAQEEVFGPVLVVIPYDDDDDAVRIANGTIYGLQTSVYSASRERANSMANRFRSGTVCVNGGFHYGVDVPFGGYKQSGVGRENGIDGFEELLETKLVAEDMGPYVEDRK